MKGELDMPKDGKQVLFSFGTLQDPDVFHTVTKHPMTDVATSKAWLPNHKRVSGPDGKYPLIVYSPGDYTSGLVFEGIGPELFDRLTWFEAPEFDLVQKAVSTEYGVFETQLFLPVKTADSSDQASWDMEGWQESQKNELLRSAALTRCE